jgi:hypothetical protein
MGEQSYKKPLDSLLFLSWKSPKKILLLLLPLPLLQQLLPLLLTLLITYKTHRYFFYVGS